MADQLTIEEIEAHHEGMRYTIKPKIEDNGQAIMIVGYVYNGINFIESRYEHQVDPSNVGAEIQKFHQWAHEVIERFLDRHDRVTKAVAENLEPA